MNFRHKIERININGLKEFAVQYYIADELLIGRGASCQIRLPFRTVAIAHARLTTGEDGSPIIEDLTGEKGVRVNGKPVRVRALQAGDEVQIGEASFKTFYDGNYWGFHEIRADVIPQTSGEVVQKELRRLDLTRFFPRLVPLSLLMIVLVLVPFFIEPITGSGRELWSAGPLANVHHMLGSSCMTCHRVPFKAVPQGACESCHRMSDHGGISPAVAQGNPRLGQACGQCHAEHNGGKHPVNAKSALCTSCHANLKDVHPDAVRPAIPSFRKHPNFRISTIDLLDGEHPKLNRIPLDEVARDPTKLAFNHKVHLANELRGLPNGKSKLQCMDCHALAPNRRDVLPVSFKRHCASCHPLTFDERLPTTEVPHGNAEEVYNFMYAEYAKLFLVSRPENERMALVRRFKPGSSVINEPDIQFTREFVAEESRNAEREIFTRTGCKLCHEIVPRGQLPTGSVQGRTTNVETSGEAAYTVLKPRIPVRWMPGAIFDHGAHESMTCLSCHQAAPQSEKTSDVLLPSIKLCQSCHTDAPSESRIASTCITCHSYHDSIALDETKRRSVAEVLLGP